jgi:nucleoside-diphosphate-sugar epimerase
VRRVLVTGATGFIGRHSLGALTERGFEVHAVSSRAAGGLAPGVTWHRADLLDEQQATRLADSVRPSHLLHFAWYAEHGKYWTSPENARWLEASTHLLRAFAAAGGRRVAMAGTCAEYDWSHERLVEDETPLAPATPYGQAKNELRARLFDLAPELGISAAWGRIFFLYGPGEHPDRLVASVVRSLLAGERAPTTDGSQVRDFLHVADVADAFAALLATDVEGSFNIASGEPVQVRDVLAAIGEAVGRPELIEFGALPQRPGDPEKLVADVRRMRENVGWRPQYNLAAGIAETVNALRGPTGGL